MANGTVPESTARRAALTAAVALAVLGTGSASAIAATHGNQGARSQGGGGAGRVRLAGRPTDRPAGKVIGPGSAKVKALIAKVNRAYHHVPAVELAIIPRQATFRTPRRFVLILRSGRVVAEEFTRAGHGGTMLVATRPGRTYSRPAGARCWRRLPASSPQSLADVGMPFPYPRIGIKVLPPKATSSGWTVMSENRAEFWFLALQPRRPAHLLDASHQPLKRFITYTIGTRSYRLRYVYIQYPSSRPQRTWPAATLKATALPAAPRLPRTAPAC